MSAPCLAPPPLQAIESIHAILRPLEILTRVWPKRPVHPAAATAAPLGSGAAGDAPAGAAGGTAAAADGGAAGQAAGGGGTEGGGGAGGAPAATPAGETPAAGRQAMLAAEAALGHLDRDRARAERRTSACILPCCMCMSMLTAAAVLLRCFDE